MPLISVRDLHFSYGDQDGIAAVRGISLDIEKGERIAIVGANGSGKTTLVKHFNGLLKPTSGEVVVCGLSSTGEENLNEIRKNIGMIFQSPDEQIIAARLEDDIAFGPENLGLREDEIRERVDWAIKKLCLEDLREKPPYYLSNGQKQRLAIAGVLAMKPEAVIFDEAAAMLDPEGRADLRNIQRELLAEGTSIITVTHDMEEACKASRIIVLSKGKVLADGPPAHIFTEEGLSDWNLALPPILRISMKISRLYGKGFGECMDVEELSEAVLAHYRSIHNDNRGSKNNDH